MYLASLFLSTHHFCPQDSVVFAHRDENEQEESNVIEAKYGAAMKSAQAPRQMRAKSMMVVVVVAVVVVLLGMQTRGCDGEVEVEVEVCGSVVVR